MRHKTGQLVDLAACALGLALLAVGLWSLLPALSLIVLGILFLAAGLWPWGKL